MCSNTREKIGFDTSTEMTELWASFSVVSLKAVLCLQLDEACEIFW